LKYIAYLRNIEFLKISNN